jgi:hypothetical protein
MVRKTKKGQGKVNTLEQLDEPTQTALRISNLHTITPKHCACQALNVARLTLEIENRPSDDISTRMRAVRDLGVRYLRSIGDWQIKSGGMPLLLAYGACVDQALYDMKTTQQEMEAAWLMLEKAWQSSAWTSEDTDAALAMARVGENIESRFLGLYNAAFCDPDHMPPAEDLDFSEEATPEEAGE